MHELLAVCLLVVDRDSLDITSLTESQLGGAPGSSAQAAITAAMCSMLDRRFVEHDAYALFSSVMRSGRAFYEWRAEEGPVRRIIWFSSFALARSRATRWGELMRPTADDIGDCAPSANHPSLSGLAQFASEKDRSAVVGDV